MRKLLLVQKRVDAELFRIRATKPYPPDLYDAAFHLIFSGGKRVRPFLLLESAYLFGADDAVSLPPAVGLELLHNFTLIHDDIMDQDSYRRGVATTYAKYGVPIAITAGDALFSYLFSHIVEGMSRAGALAELVTETIRVLSQASLRVCEGQAMDVMYSKYVADSSECMKMIELKTASLFSAAAEIGAMIGGASSSQAVDILRYGRDLGMMFQIVDDILGVSGDPEVTGKPVGSDLRRGKRTLILLYALERCSDVDGKRIRAVLGNQSATQEEVGAATQILLDMGSLDYARKVAHTYRESALRSLGGLPRNEHHETLASLVDFLFTRKK
ncbi:MAG: polyprenyl synthetase family protein [Candidatus Geothermarchaeales archaeon]